MQISKILEVNNYRNLTGIMVDFNNHMNFIVGKNNVGKTNILELINTLVNIGKFYKGDFYNPLTPIEVVFQINYSEDELGYFEDNFDIDDNLQITIVARQQTVDDRIEFYHRDSEVPINSRKIKGLNFIYYSSLRTPSKELNFNKNQGTGKVLSYLMNQSFLKKSIDEVELLKTEDIKLVIDDLNEQIDKLNGLSKEKISAFINNEGKNLINRIVEIGDQSSRSLNDLGDGLRYAFNIFLHILELLVHLKTTNKNENYEKLMIIMPNGKKFLPLLIGLDEPEIHQHPYRQRALIKSIQKIINNQNQKFTELIKELFDIDGFIGQVFVVTHSPNILLNDYKQIVRVYNHNDVVKVTSGMKIDFEPKVHKHLVRSFTYIKEAMFSEGVILVEGDTEHGAVPVFAARLGYDIDEEGIGVIKLDGADSIKRCLELYRAFKISVCAIIDKDKEDMYSEEEDVYFTNEIDFEEEVFSLFTLREYAKFLKEVDYINSLIKILKTQITNFNAREFIGNQNDYEIEDEDGLRVMENIKEEQVNFLKNNKTAVNGSLLATYVDVVPESFRAVIKNSIKE